MSKNNENKLVPRIRFPEYLNDVEWKKDKLEKLTNITIGEFVIKTKQNPNSPYPVYNGGRSFTGFYDEYNNEANKIVISARGAYAGYVNLLKQRYWAGNSCYSVSIINEKLIDLDFLFYYIKENQRRFTDNQQAANIPSVSKADVQKFIANYPENIKEQQKIAACLSSLDEVITAENQKLEVLKDHKRGLLQNLLPQTAETVPKFRFKEFEDSGEWEETTLIQVADYENGKAHEQDIADDGDFIVVNSKFISQDGEVKKFTNTAFLPATKGDVLMVLSDIPNGKAIAKCFLVEEDNRYTVNQRICRITPRNLNSKILYYLLNRNPYFLAFDDGVKQTNLRKEDVLNCPLLIPEDPKEQEKIADTLSSVDDLIIAQNQKLEALQLHKKGLLQGLFPSINNEE